MEEARRHPRIEFRLAVELFSQDLITSQQCSTRDICLGGLFAVGAQGISANQPVRLAIGQEEGAKLHLDGRAVRSSASGTGFEFVGNSPSSIEVLQSLLTPKWDGENLLDAVVKVAPWYPGDNLSSWLRLTSLVTEWQRIPNRTSSSGDDSSGTPRR